jgi:hypothetical protein
MPFDGNGTLDGLSDQFVSLFSFLVRFVTERHDRAPFVGNYVETNSVRVVLDWPYFPHGGLRIACR